MKIRYLLTALSLGIFIIAGCATDKDEGKVKTLAKTTVAEPEPVKAPVVSAKPVENKPEPIRYFTKVSTERISVSVKYKDDKTFEPVGRAIEGAIANSGYEVSNNNAFIFINIAGKIDKFDKFGNFLVYDGTAELSVYKNVKNDKGELPLVARTSVSEKGGRTLGEDSAKASLADKLAAKSVEWTNDVCKRELSDLAVVKATLPYSVFEKVFGPNKNDIQKSINDMLVRAGKLDGVFSCNLISVDDTSLTIEIVYRKKNFPNGIIYEQLSPDINLKNSKDPVGDFMKCVFKVK